MKLEGQQLGQCRLLHLLATGGLSDTYLAETMSAPSHPLASKVLPWPHHLSSTPVIAAAEQYFFRQVEAISQLQHPSIVPIYDYGKVTFGDEEYFYLTMPFFPEGSLKEWRWRRDSRTEQVSPQEVAHLIEQAADALQHAHDRYIIHQHIRWSNFLVRTNTNSSQLPDVLLTDFVAAEYEKLLLSSRTQQFLGTPLYIAPERLKGISVPASDQYVVATMIYEMLTDRIPFLGKNVEELIYQLLSTTPEPPSTFNPQLSKGVDEVLLHALAKRPEDRFASIAEFSRAFQQALHI
ncbi:MAG TPA: serine/threonine-protein kinase [Ktedonobacteraceae bacterium]|nr:serine/threonine-protein kinase [Ktedonobacteraceae bacterium]